MKILIIGNGFIGRRCAEAWPDAILSDKIISSAKDVEELLDEHKPDSVLNAAGVVGKPNVDWCETHQVETITGNTVLPIMIAEACQKKGVYLLHIGTGCVYYGYSSDPKGWKESDFANPSAVYTRSKYAADLVLTTLPNVGIGRIRMPIDYIPSPGNLIDKLASYKKVIDVENSVTVLDDMVQVFKELLEKQATGIFHVTNPGTIKHREIVALYEELVDPSHTNEWITEPDLVKEGLASKTRSNNFLASENLEKLGIHMRPIKEALRDTMEKYTKIK
jgi:3,5-epimerase/4-reductase